MEDVIATLDRLAQSHLIEPNTRSTETVKGASHIRVTSAGWYYRRHLIETFAYLDLVLQDTPLNDGSVEYDLRQSVFNVNNMTDDEDKKLERVQARFDRVGRFIEYLEMEEESEFQRFDLGSSSSPLAEKIVPRLKAEFEDERNWILKRLRENREKYREEYTSSRYVDDEDDFLDSDGEDDPSD